MSDELPRRVDVVVVTRRNAPVGAPRFDSAAGSAMRATDCQHPSCTDEATEQYEDAHGNSVDVCSTHYYSLVSGESMTKIERDAEPDETTTPQRPFGEAVGVAQELGDINRHSDTTLNAINTEPPSRRPE